MGEGGSEYHGENGPVFVRSPTPLIPKNHHRSGRDRLFYECHPSHSLEGFLKALSEALLQMHILLFLFRCIEKTSGVFLFFFYETGDLTPLKTSHIIDIFLLTMRVFFGFGAKNGTEMAPIKLKAGRVVFWQRIRATIIGELMLQ